MRISDLSSDGCSSCRYTRLAEIAASCAGRGYTLTVYVDDVTIAGATGPIADVWQVRRIIHRTGLRYHKLKHYVDTPAEITCVIVRDGKVVVPNRQRPKKRQLVLALQRVEEGDGRLRGRLTGISGQIR